MFTCVECENSFENNLKLVSHMRAFHQDIEVYHCSETHCDRIYSTFNSYRKHPQREHGGEPNISSFETLATSSCSMENIALCHTLATPPICSDNLDESDKVSEIVIVNEEHVNVDNELEISSKINSSNLSDKFIESLRSHNVQLLSKLYSYTDLSKKRVQTLQEDFKSFLNSSSVNFLKDTVLSHLSELNEDPDIKIEIEKLFKNLQNPFHEFRTAHRSFREFKLIGTLISPEHVNIGVRDEYRMERDLTVIKKVPLTAEFISMRMVLRVFFALPKILEDTLIYLKSLENCQTIISNYIQGDYWKSRVKSNEKIIFPVAIYFDDYENNNPLGRHRNINKCGALYFSIMCLPPKYRSKLSNIFLFFLVNTLDRKLVQKSELFEKVIEELRYLENFGITLKLNGEEKQIYFKLAAILGDNLAIHELFGLTQSFNSTYYCRFCLIEKKNTSKILSETSCILRDRNNYNQGLSKSCTSETGIKEECCFHALPDFHITENLSVDVMHDFLEGVCQYDLAQVLKYFVKTSKLTLEELNNLINGFNYCYHDRMNKPPPILKEHLNNSQIYMSAAEMLSFIRNLPLIIGHLIPNDSQVWELVLKLAEITNVITAKYHQYDHCDFLDCIITEYLSLLTELFPGSMKPKHHFLLHYGRVMRTSGPLWNLSSMRFESKNKEAKGISHVAINRINITSTIASKHQLKLNNYFNNFEAPLDIIIGPKETQKSKVHNQEQLSSIFPELDENINVEIKWLKFNLNRIINNSILIIPTDDGPLFYMVTRLLQEQEKQNITIIVENIECHFDEHFYAYEIYKYTKLYKHLLWDDIRYGYVTNRVRASNAIE